ncbi:MAG: TonB-dependent receptor plug domain-containing protein [Bacteroidetes bacterium]|nr:TonB-dependent receptor plug domain-containing protein [Bacteroidota bacterium]
MKSPLILFLLLISSVFVSAQNGTIRGSVIEDATGDPVIFADVLVKGHPNGASTDIDGKFSISLAPGTYTLEVAYLGYQTLVLTDVVVKANDVTILNDLRIKEKSDGEGNVIQQVTINVKTNKNTEASLITMKQRSPTILDGIPAAKMELIGDPNAAEAAKRVTGVSVEDGKYVYVRGLGDRYTKTMLNNVDIPGLDPDKNSLQMDLFPANLIDRITVSKNFSAELPADFTGGLLNVETKDFPDKKIFNVSIGTSYNPAMNLNKNYISYQGGKYDFLGFDDGSRALPDGAEKSTIPTPISGSKSQQVNDFVNSFNPTLGGTRQRSPLDFSASITFGNQISLTKGDSMPTEKDPKLGYIFSLSYKTDYKYYSDVAYGEFQRSQKSSVYDMVQANMQTGGMGEHNVLIGMLGGIAYKTKLSKYRFTVMLLQSGESKAGIFEIDNASEAVGQSGYYAISNNLEYNQRTLANVLLQGNHVIPKKGWEIDWRVSPTLSSSTDPDIRKTAFTYASNDTFFSAGAGGNPSRIWRSLTEINVTAKVDFKKEYSLGKMDSKLRFGFSETYKKRDYEIISLFMQFFGPQNWSSTDVNQVLKPEYVYPNAPNKIYYQTTTISPNPNAYSSDVTCSSGYISNEFQLSKKVKAIAGLRGEYYLQHHTGRDQAWARGDHVSGKNLDDTIVINQFNLFPSLNFIYSYTEKSNLRFTYGRTTARPSFKELSFAQILDPITNRFFNGSLFQYSSWAGNLVPTMIDNLDARWEMFLKRNQMFSVSGFYKMFTNPIEMVRIPEQQTTTEYQPRNVGNGKLLGVEIEVQKNFDFIHPAFHKWSFSGNFTFVQSQIDMTSTEYNARKQYEKEGQDVGHTRPMAGQSPWVVNAGISFNDYENGTNAGIFYNVKGPALYIVGGGLFPDIYSEPFNSLNFSFNKKLGKEQKTQIDFKVSNILNDKLEAFYKSYKADKQVFSSINPGRSFSFGIKHSF